MDLLLMLNLTMAKRKEHYDSKLLLDHNVLCVMLIRTIYQQRLGIFGRKCFFFEEGQKCSMITMVHQLMHRHCWSFVVRVAALAIWIPNEFGIVHTICS